MEYYALIPDKKNNTDNEILKIISRLQVLSSQLKLLSQACQQLAENISYE